MRHLLMRHTAALRGQLTSASALEIFRHTLIISLSDESEPSTIQLAKNSIPARYNKIIII